MTKVNSMLLGDGFKLMEQLPDESADMIISDLTSKVLFSTPVPGFSVEKLWNTYERVISRKGAVVLIATQPLTSLLVQCRPLLFKYEWIWYGDHRHGLLRYQDKPPQRHATVLVFSRGDAERYDTSLNTCMTYHPQYRAGEPVNEGEYAFVANMRRSPDSMLYFPAEEGNAVSETPASLYEFLIRSYSNPSELVMDACGDKGGTALACINTGRKYIVFEEDTEAYPSIP